MTRTMFSALWLAFGSLVSLCSVRNSYIVNPQANAFCERLIGTVRGECLDFLIPLNDRHLRSLLKEWVTHYNRGRPHASLGPGIPDLGAGQQRAKLCGHHVPIDQQVVAEAILGGLHHEYRLERIAA